MWHRMPMHRMNHRLDHHGLRRLIIRLLRDSGVRDTDGLRDGRGHELIPRDRLVRGVFGVFHERERVAGAAEADDGVRLQRDPRVRGDARAAANERAFGALHVDDPRHPVDLAPRDAGVLRTHRRMPDEHMAHGGVPAEHQVGAVGLESNPADSAAAAVALEERVQAVRITVHEIG